MKRNVGLIIVLSLALLIMNCDSEKNPSIWDENDAGEATPVISSVEPALQQYGGVGTKKLITITGTNFNSDADKNFVYFGTEPGEIIEGSTTELVVTAPANYGDSLEVEVHTQGAYLPAVYGGSDNPTYYTLISSERVVGEYDEYTPPQGICVDGEGNLFVTSDKRVDKITADGTIIESAYELKSKFTNNIQVGPENSLYYSWTKYIFKTDTTTGTHSYAKVSDNVNCMDFDENLNLYIAGDEFISKVDYSDLSETLLQEFEDVSFCGCRVYEGDLYLVAQYIGSDLTVSTAPYLCKVALNSDGSLDGDLEVIQDWAGTDYESMVVNQLIMSSDGEVLLATENMSLLSLENGVLSQVYSAVLGEYAINNVAWGIDEEFFVNTNNDEDKDITLLGIMYFEESAPYYGRN